MDILNYRTCLEFSLKGLIAAIGDVITATYAAFAFLLAGASAARANSSPFSKL